MARTEISLTQFTRDGVVLAGTAGDATNGNVIANDGHVGLIVENTGTTVSRTLTINFAKTVDGFTVTPRTETLAVGEKKGFGPFPFEEYGSRLAINVDNAELTVLPVHI